MTNEYSLGLEGLSPALKDLSEFLKELQSETDRGLALVGAALIDHRLGEILLALMTDDDVSRKLIAIEPAPGALSSLSAKADACYALGLIEEFEYKEIRLITKVRNRFGHERHGFTFESQEVAKHCLKLASDRPKREFDATSPKALYRNAVTVIALRLFNREHTVSKERRTHQQWVDPSRSRWISGDEAMPQPGTKFVAYGKTTPPEHSS